MLDFEIREDANGDSFISTTLSGSLLTEVPVLNKGTAFTRDERRSLGLEGLLPPHVTHIEEQLARTYGEFRFKTSENEKHIYLRSLQDRNEVLYYRLLLEHLEEMMPLVYTPVVGWACRHFSHIYRRPRGLFISYPRRDRITQILNNRPFRDVDVIVVTDGERILGLGDQGAGGMGIPIGKLSLYTLCAGIHPSRTLPILLDVGTDNNELLNDPKYLGWRHERLRGDAYLEFVDAFVETVRQVLPNTLLQWEDFSRDNASMLLSRYQNELCTFNDDIQGTAAVTVAALLSAMRSQGAALSEQRYVLLGAGSAAIGIANQLADELVDGGMSEAEAAGLFWILNSRGLLHEGMKGILPFQKRFVRAQSEVASWQKSEEGNISLDEVVSRVKPTVLVGVSGQPGVFTEPLIRTMAQGSKRPIVLPLSNPTSKAEATPEQIIAWSEGKAIVATGSPFAPVQYGGVTHTICQCNNSYVFPGMGLGVLASRAQRVTSRMFMAASAELAKIASEQPGSPVLPPLSMIREVSRRIAMAVGEQAMRESLSSVEGREELARNVRHSMWRPEYVKLVPEEVRKALPA